jgi:pilus assembly protein TadC
MTSPALALVLLAAAVTLWSPPDPAGSRLASVSGAAVRVGGWRRLLPGRIAKDTSALQLAVLAGSVGSLFGVLAGWPHGLIVGVTAAALAWLCARRLMRASGRSRRAATTDQLGMAAGWDLLAACLRAGLPVPTAVRAVAEDLPAAAGDALRSTADLLALGADPVDAWAPALDSDATAGLARGARRTARSGTALAGVAAALAVDVRGSASDAAEAKAQRAAVLITGPLGLCFLPAFVCLGIVPVVVGLATQLSVNP